MTLMDAHMLLTQQLKEFSSKPAQYLTNIAVKTTKLKIPCHLHKFLDRFASMNCLQICMYKYITHSFLLDRILISHRKKKDRKLMNSSHNMPEEPSFFILYLMVVCSGN